MHPGIRVTALRPPRRLGRWISAAVIASLVITVGLAWGVHQAPESVDLPGPVFGGIATIVALILPAAALANTYVENRIVDYTGEPRDAELARLFRKVVDALSLLPLAFCCFIVAFLLSVATFFHIETNIWAGGLRVGDALLGAALALVLVGLALLLPLLFQMLDRGLAVKTLRLLEETAAHQAALPAPKPRPRQEARSEGDPVGRVAT